jgi:NADPH2:quinone reductase
VLTNIETGAITPRIWGQYPLTDAAGAHADLESGKSSGSIILKT